MADQKPLKIAVIGAGTGGLSLAATLMKRNANVSVKVFEQSSDIKARGGGIFLYQAVEVFRRLGLLEDFLKLANTIDDFECFSDGQMLFQCKFRKSIHHVPRQHLQQFLFDAIGDKRHELVQFGAKVASIDEGGAGVTVTFADGATDVFDLVIGGDGARSVVASEAKLFHEIGKPVWQGFQFLYAISEKPVRQNKQKMTIHYSYAPDKKTGNIEPHCKMSLSSGAGEGSFDIAIIVRRENQEISNAWDSEMLGSEMLKIAEHAFPDNHDNVHDIIKNSERVFSWGILEMPLRPTWTSRGKKTFLLGDAAHAMTPFAGQGCNTAIQDGFCLGNHLADALAASKDGTIDVGAVLAKVEKIRKPSAEAMLKKGANIGSIQLATGCKRIVRNCAFKCCGEKIVNKIFEGYVKDMPLDV